MSTTNLGDQLIASLAASPDTVAPARGPLADAFNRVVAGRILERPQWHLRREWAARWLSSLTALRRLRRRAAASMRPSSSPAPGQPRRSGDRGSGDAADADGDSDPLATLAYRLWRWLRYTRGSAFSTPLQALLQHGNLLEGCQASDHGPRWTEVRDPHDRVLGTYEDADQWFEWLARMYPAPWMEKGGESWH